MSGHGYTMIIKMNLQQRQYWSTSQTRMQVIDGVSLDPFTVRDQYNDVDTFSNTDKGAHFWGRNLTMKLS